MGIEQVKEEVIASARRQAAALIAEARKEADSSMRAAERQAEEKKRIILEKTEREIADEKTRETAAAELEAAKMLMEAKKRLIDEAFQAAKEQASSATPPERKERIRKLVEKARKQIDVHTIICSEKDIKNIDGYKTLAGNISGGIIAENREGTIRIDYSDDTIMESIREETLKDVAKALFKDE